MVLAHPSRITTTTADEVTEAVPKQDISVFLLTTSLITYPSAIAPQYCLWLSIQAIFQSKLPLSDLCGSNFITSFVFYLWQHNFLEYCV